MILGMPHAYSSAELAAIRQEGYNQYIIDHPSVFGTTFALFYNATDFDAVVELISVDDVDPIISATFNVAANACQYINASAFPNKNTVKVTLTSYDDRELVSLVDQFFTQGFQASDCNAYHSAELSAAFGDGMHFLGFTIYDPTKNGFSYGASAPPAEYVFNFMNKLTNPLIVTMRDSSETVLTSVTLMTNDVFTFSPSTNPGCDHFIIPMPVIPDGKHWIKHQVSNVGDTFFITYNSPPVELRHEVGDWSPGVVRSLSYLEY